MPTINDFKKEVINIFLSFRCNLKCGYCINRFHENNSPFCHLKMDYDHIPWEQWTDALSRLPKESIMVFQGGEPTLYPDFNKIVSAIDNPTRIYSNLHAYSSVEEVAKIPPRENMIICTTLHAGTSSNYNIDNVLIHLEMLASIGHKIKIDIVNTPELTDHHREVAKDIPHTLKQLIGYCNGIFYGSENMMDQIDAFSGVPQKVVCAKNGEGMIAPDGSIYKCGYGMYTRDRGLAIGNLFDGIFNEEEELLCQNYGYCNPCDFFLPVRIESAEK